MTSISRRGPMGDISRLETTVLHGPVAHHGDVLLRVTVGTFLTKARSLCFELCSFQGGQTSRWREAVWRCILCCFSRFLRVWHLTEVLSKSFTKLRHVGLQDLCLNRGRQISFLLLQFILPTCFISAIWQQLNIHFVLWNDIKLSYIWHFSELNAWRIYKSYLYKHSEKPGYLVTSPSSAMSLFLARLVLRSGSCKQIVSFSWWIPSLRVSEASWLAVQNPSQSVVLWQRWFPLAGQGLFCGKRLVVETNSMETTG